MLGSPNVVINLTDGPLEVVKQGQITVLVPGPNELDPSLVPYALRQHKANVITEGAANDIELRREMREAGIPTAAPTPLDLDTAERLDHEEHFADTTAQTTDPAAVTIPEPVTDASPLVPGAPTADVPDAPVAPAPHSEPSLFADPEPTAPSELAPTDKGE